MAVIVNPSFETGDSSADSVPDSWTIVVSGASFDWALYNGLESIERYEREWLGNEGRIVAFVGSPTDLTDAIYDVAALEPVEDFEEEWSGNENRITAFTVGNLTDASYDSGTPEDFEDFEEEWSGNEGRKTVFVGVPTDLTEALYDVAADVFEDFEEEWSGNEGRILSFVGVPTDLDDAIYQDISPDDVETFSTAIALDAPASVDVGSLTVVNPGNTHRVEIKGTFVATLEVQERIEGAGTFVTIATTTTAAEVNIPAGRDAVRIETTAYTSGTPAANLLWAKLD